MSIADQSKKNMYKNNKKNPNKIQTNINTIEVNSPPFRHSVDFASENSLVLKEAEIKPQIRKLNIKKNYNLKPIEQYPIKVLKTSPLTNVSV